MTAIAVLLVIPIVMWLVQTLLLRAHGYPIRWRIHSGGAPPIVRTAGRVTTQTSLMAAAIGFPYLRGTSPLDYYGQLLPPAFGATDFISGAAIATAFLTILFLIWLSFDQVRVAPYLDFRRTTRRLAVVPFSACFGALMEEIIFRGLVMNDLLTADSVSPAAAVAGSTVVFALAHYVRSVKRRWTFAGHIMLGLMLSMAFLSTGNLWFPIGLHAGGILVIMGARPVLKYRGPAWLFGESIYPYSGAVGLIGLACLTLAVSSYRH